MAPQSDPVLFAVVNSNGGSSSKIFGGFSADGWTFGSDLPVRVSTQTCLSGSGMREDLNIPLFDGVFYEVGGFSETQFYHDVGAILFHGAVADAEKIGDTP